MLKEKRAVLNVVGLTRSLIGDHTPRIRDFLSSGWSVNLIEQVPAVTCTSQATMLTGKTPSEHGIVGNGWYFKDLAEVGFWKQNNGLVIGEKIWESLRKQDPSFTCAKLFWWYNMYSSADWSITPRPQYPADGRKIFGIYTQPYEMAPDIKRDLGAFPFFSFWGPGADIKSSVWIADSARWIYQKHEPNLSLVYLPHLDYCLQKHGPHSSKIIPELKAIDAVVGDLLDFYKKNNVAVILLSEYGITEVSRCIHPNRILRENGYLEVVQSLSWELLDCGRSKAFGVSDHQICHIYVKNKNDVSTVANLMKNVPGIKEVFAPGNKSAIGLDNDRAGDIVLMAEADTWFSYYYWLEDNKAPDFARCVDIHRKPGYDPLELFVDPKILFPKLKVISKLLLKTLGFRYYMDLIPLDVGLVKGSHGTPVSNREEGPLLISNFIKARRNTQTVPMKEVHDIILDHFSWYRK